LPTETMHERRPGLAQAVMIARDNASRAMLNERARRALVQEGALGADGVAIADQGFAIGDRVIARRNDRYRDVDNGTLGHIIAINHRTGAMTIITDAGDERALDASYAAAHLGHACALTGQRRPWRDRRMGGSDRSTIRVHPRMGLHRPRCARVRPRVYVIARRPQRSASARTTHP